MRKTNQKTNQLTTLAVAMALVGGISSVHAATYVTPILGGTMTFDDWGYSGPQGQNAMQFSYNGFDGAAQIQRVVTLGPDRLTPDAAKRTVEDGTLTKIFYDGNMDSQVNFYKWAYTTKAGSTFNNMQIDADGDYLIKREDMAFQFYDVYDYQYDPSVSGIADATTRTLGVADGTYLTNIGFQPYALSDAEGWCGSVMATHPGAAEAMAGQVKFDFGFEAFLPPAGPSSGADYTPGTGGMQIVKDFIMRSYGSLNISVTTAAGGVANLTFDADAVVNNTSPTAGRLPGDPDYNMGYQDDAYYNKVSFMGGGIVPQGTWVKTFDPAAPMANTNIDAVLDESQVVDANGDGVDDTNPNIIWHANTFTGYPYLLRADGIRIMEWVNYDLYGTAGAKFVDEFGTVYNYDENGNVVMVQNLAAVPVPAAVWLFGSGLLGLIGISRRKKS